MIASLRGQVISNSSSQLVVEVAGVGYLVHVSSQTARELPVSESAFLHTALIVREDAFTLFGFLTADELELFDLLRSVTGVGPKSALAIMSQLTADQVRAAVSSENDSVFKAVSGIGPKTAKLITVTLAGKLKGDSLSSNTAPSTAKSADLSNVIAAIQGLGWSERQAVEAVREVASELKSGESTDVLLRAALARLGTSKSVSGGAQ